MMRSFLTGSSFLCSILMVCPFAFSYELDRRSDEKREIADLRFGKPVIEGIFGRGGLHSFPATDVDGKQLANEFQILSPENIKFSENFKEGSSSQSEGAYSFSEISPTLIRNDDIVTVSYRSSTPSSKDWIGAYSPPDVDITTTVPVKYGWCDDSDTYLNGEGTGYLTFNLTNIRSDIVFYYFTNSTSYPVAVAVSSSEQTVSFADVNEQLRPRVVATGNPDVLKLVWSSASNQKPTLRWGLSPGVYTKTSSAKIFSIGKDELCGSPATTKGWFDLGHFYGAMFTGMLKLSSQVVYYSFGDAATENWSPEYSLLVPPAPGTQPPGRPTRVLLFDDLGRGSTDMTYTWNEYGRPSIYTTMAAGAEVSQRKVDAIYHGGDISYATGYLVSWDFFFDMISPMASGTVYLSTVGNHETDWPDTASYYTGTDSGGECGVLSTRLLPQPYPATTNKPWWSYDVGLIHMVGMSTEHNYTIGSEQWEWLKKDLESVDRSVTPWIVFGGHRPMYINSNYGGSANSDIGVMDDLILNIEDLLWNNRVNLAFWGHNHVVQRQSAVYKKQVVQASTPILESDGIVTAYHDDPQATVHLVIGTSGASFTKNAVTPPPEWNELTFYQYGYSAVTAVNSSFLLWEWIINNGTGIVLDRMSITQADPINEVWKR